MGVRGEVEIGAGFGSFSWLQKGFGYVPNLFRAQVLLPRALPAEAELVRTVLFTEGALSRRQKEYILLAVAEGYGNRYCIALHSESLRRLGAADAEIEQILAGHGHTGLAAGDALLIEFPLKLSRRPDLVGPQDADGLRGHGFADEHVLETVLTTAIGRFLCTVAAGLQAQPDVEPPSPPRTVPSDPGRVKRDAGDGPPRRGPYVRIADLDPVTFPPYVFCLENFGFIPNVLLAQSLRPDVIGPQVGLVRTVLLTGDLLARKQKECIFVAVSAAHLSTYCVALHCEILRAMGVSPDESDQIAVDHHHSGLPDADKALLDFALKLVRRQAECSRQDLDELQGWGFTDEQILEAVLVAALAGFYNTLSIGLGAAPDYEPKRIFRPHEVHLFPAAARLTSESGPAGAPAADPDAGIVARVQGGDVDAFEELVRRHQHRVYRALIGILGNVEDAQDAMQDAFLKAFQHMAEFQARSKFSTWLISIAHNTGLQRLRERREMDSLDDGGVWDDESFRPRQIAAWQDEPEKSYSEAEIRQLVEQGVMRLPYKYRVAVMLRDVEQLTTEETAAALQLSVPALKARIFRGRLMLREALAPYFADRRMSS